MRKITRKIANHANHANIFEPLIPERRSPTRHDATAKAALVAPKLAKAETTRNGFIHHLSPVGGAGFDMAKTTRIAHCCPMKIAEAVRKYAAEQGIAEEEALKKGMSIARAEQRSNTAWNKCVRSW